MKRLYSGPSTCGGEKRGQPAQAVGRSRSGRSTKIHTLMDALGNSVRFFLTGGQEADMRQAPPLLADLGRIGAIIGGKADDAQAALEVIEQCGAQAVIPPKVSRLSQRDYDTYRYRARADIEYFFQRLKQFRRLATRYEELAQHFQAFLSLAATIIWLR